MVEPSRNTPTTSAQPQDLLFLRFASPFSFASPSHGTKKTDPKTGTGKPTERGYFYRTTSPLTNLNVTIDTSITTPTVDHGIILSEGDGTVNLLSLGYMCTKGWTLPRFNPAGVKIVTREMKHEPDRFSPRGGPNTGDHVDILGRTGLNELILKIAAGKGESIEDDVFSDIKNIGQRVKVYDEGETEESRAEFKRKRAEEKRIEREREMEEMRPTMVEEEVVVVESPAGKEL